MLGLKLNHVSKRGYWNRRRFVLLGHISGNMHMFRDFSTGPYYPCSSGLLQLLEQLYNYPIFNNERQNKNVWMFYAACCITIIRIGICQAEIIRPRNHDMGAFARDCLLVRRIHQWPVVYFRLDQKCVFVDSFIKLHKHSDCRWPETH